MANYFEMSHKELAAEKEKLEESYKKFQDMGLKLNMARGKPAGSGHCSRRMAVPPCLSSAPCRAGVVCTCSL